jgi:hypothetical protein
VITVNNQPRERRVSAPSAKIIENRKVTDASMEPPARRPVRKESVLVPAAMIEKLYTAVMELTEQCKRQSAEISSLKKDRAEEKESRKEEIAAVIAELGVLKKAFLDSQSRIPTWAQMVASGSPTTSSTPPVSTAQVLSTSSSGSMSSRPRDHHTITVMMDKLHEHAAQEVDFKDTPRLRQRLEQSLRGCTATKDISTAASTLISTRKWFDLTLAQTTLRQCAARKPGLTPISAVLDFFSPTGFRLKSIAFRNTLLTSRGLNAFVKKYRRSLAKRMGSTL